MYLDHCAAGFQYFQTLSFSLFFLNSFFLRTEWLLNYIRRNAVLLLAFYYTPYIVLVLDVIEDLVRDKKRAKFYPNFDTIQVRLRMLLFFIN